MPELPEVETVRCGLVPIMEGNVISKADVRRPDLRWPFPKDMQARLTGRKVLRLRRRSKYILADLDSQETLLVHLGMSGRMLVERRALANFHAQHGTLAKHDHVVLDMSTGDRVIFNDARRFGAMDLFDTSQEDAHWLLSKLGPEPFGNMFNEAHLVSVLKSRRSPIKSVLLDQRIVAGLGNIYVCEALFRAGISPMRQAARLSEKRIRPLVPIIREVLEDAIKAGGSSLRDYRQADGELGYFQHSFSVYGREGEECVARDCADQIRRKVQSGRSSFYCPSCQR